MKWISPNIYLKLKSRKNKCGNSFTYTKLPYSRAPSPVPLLSLTHLLSSLASACLGENSFALSLLRMSQQDLPTLSLLLSLRSPQLAPLYAAPLATAAVASSTDYSGRLRLSHTLRSITNKTHSTASCCSRPPPPPPRSRRSRRRQSALR